MYCGNCDAALGEDAQFCSSCGYRVILPEDPEAALYTDGPPDTDATGAPNVTTSLDPPVVDPGPPASPPPPAPNLPPAPTAAPQSVDEGTFTAYEDEEPAAGRPALGLILGALAAVVAVIVAVAVLVGGGDDQPAAQKPGVSAAASGGSSGKPGASASANPAGSAKPVKVPAGAVRCSEASAEQAYASYRGNNATTCAFADSVRKSFIEAGAKEGELKAYSPATKKSYTMTCSGSAVVTCRGGNNAVVYLAAS